MAARVPAGLTARALRRFGLTVAGPFLLLAGVAWWRGHPTSATVLASLGVGMAGFALVLPSTLGPVERLWMGLAHVLGRVNTRVLLTVVWMLTIVPIGVIMRVFGRDPLTRTIEGGPSYWVTRPRRTDPKTAMERWF